MATVHLQRVSKRYQDGSWGVREVNLEIADQEFLVLVGPSGCGKSTTLRLIAGLEDCTDGTVEINGKQVNNLPPAQRDIAMVFQNYALYPHMTVYRNIGFGLELKRGGLIGDVKRLFGRDTASALTRQQIDRRIRQTAEKLGIESLLEKRPHQLSGGERQRVALGRAIARNPAAFLFDEPLSNLDAKLRGLMRSELKRLHTELKATMIFVTHDQVEAMTLGDRIAVMKDGLLQQVGPPAEIYQRPANEFVAGFIGTYPINLIEGRLVTNERENEKTGCEENEKQSCEAIDRIVFESDDLRVVVFERTNVNEKVQNELESRVNKPIKFGIRPEDVILNNSDDDLNRQPQVKLGKHKPATGKIEQIDQLGDALLVHLKVNDNLRILARQSQVDENSSLALGDEVAIQFDMQKIHLFDGASGLRVEQV